MKRAISYARLSKGEKYQNPERQFLKNRQYAELNELLIIAEITDSSKGETDPFSRIKVKEMLNLKPDVLLVVSSDRWSRETPQKVFKSFEMLKKRGVAFVSVTEPYFNMDSDFSDLIMGVILWFNNYYVKELSRKIKQGLERRKAQGKKLGRKPLDPMLKNYILHDRNSGRTIREIAQRQEVSIGAVHKTLKEKAHLLNK